MASLTIPTEPIVRVLLADPHAAVRDGLPGLLRPDAIQTAIAVDSTVDIELLIERHAPDVILVAAALVRRDDRRALPSRLMRQGIRTPVVVYADGDGPEHVTSAVNDGAAGVVGQGRPVAQVARALRTVASGSMWFGERDWTHAPLSSGAAQALRRSDGLSESERRVLALVAAGSDTDEIAVALTVSPHTVRTHVRNLMRKLDAQSRAHAVAIAMREAAIELVA